MTIAGLKKLLVKIAPKSISTRKLADLAGSKVAIDANLFIYKWHSIGVKNSKNKDINHIQGAVYRTKMLLDAKIIPIWVFDGAPPTLKVEVIAKRRVRKEQGQGIKLPYTIYDECKELFDAMGVMWMDAPAEAEAECAYLCKLGRVDYVMTDDLDALAFGAPRVISGLDSKRVAEIIDLKTCLSEMGLSQEGFLRLCILLGTDYNPRLLPPMRALKLAREGFDPTTNELFSGAVAAYEEFKNPKVLSVMVRSGVIDRDRLRELLTRYEITEKKISNILATAK